MHIPLMAGSSVPLTLLVTDAQVEPGAELSSIVGMSYHTLTTYGFHGLKLRPGFGRRRTGGVKRNQAGAMSTGHAVFEASAAEYDPKLFGPRIEKLETTHPEARRSKTSSVRPVPVRS